MNRFFSKKITMLFLSLFVLSSCGVQEIKDDRIKEGEAPPEAGEVEIVRVLIFENVKEVKINRMDGEKEVVQFWSKNKAKVDGKTKNLPLTYKNKKSFIYIDGNPYRGKIEVHASKKGLLIVNEINIEDYVASVINSEISSSWHVQALKTQSVIARTYALHELQNKKGELFNLRSTHLGQMYEGASSEDSISLKAVRSTRGEIVSFRGKVALTVYHSNAGGVTEASENVWSSAYPYLRSVKSPYDRRGTNFEWSLSIKDELFEDMLNKKGFETGTPYMISFKEQTPAGRVKSLEIKSKDGMSTILTGEDLRKVIGYATLRSTMFSVHKMGDSFVFRGRGSGHGVGLSQWGVKGMAEDGYKYKEILEHFYPGTNIISVW